MFMASSLFGVPNVMRIWSLQRGISILSSNSKPPSSSKLHYCLQHCSNSKSLNQGKQTHQKIIQCQLGKNPFLVTKLVQMYADCDDLASARKLFDELLEPNVFAWTAILGFYSRHGMYEECVGAYGEMILRGVLPDGYVFPKVLRACAHFSSLKVGIRVHKDVIISGFEINVQVCNSLIEMYSKCGDIRCAKQVFDEMVGRDLLTWNLMISGFVCNGMLGWAIELFGCMNSDGCEPDVVTLNTVMDAYCRMGLCDEAKGIFKHIKEPNIISWTTLISGYSRIGNHEASLGIFRDMMNSSMVYPDLDSLSIALVSSQHLGSLLSGKEIHGYGLKRESGIVFYNSAGPALLTMYANCRRIQDAENVFRFMDPAQVVSWNAMILGFIDLGLEDLALECFRKMQIAEIKLDQTTLSTVLPTCNLKFGKQIHAFIRKSSFDLVVPVWNALIHMYSKCGCIGAAYSVFSNMLNRDLVSWNSMMGGFAMNGLGQAALELLQEMNRSGICPDSVTLTSVLSACSHSGLVDEGLRVFYSMMENGFNPTMEHYACIVDMLARDGLFEDAVSFIHRMPLEPDKCIWGALLAACLAHQNVNVAKLAAEQLVQLEPENPGHYVTLSNIYARAGRWDDAVLVRKQMESRGSLKPSGNSWFECGN
ncbi:pentatricopeptide repeat-containing protein DOT4, chloroplastic-like [Rosa rugosa]|uniref:pentatricopeptide repeat-containing protein DOT4, chloroplastic-like n=1 Tax=Rosa rugosa TaxID=74645 RepID=UPI002B415625|nr:pentatricopeptide repeat-containing protein DOT4, chloroplastic-like [Rosa rugosa]